MSTPPSAPQDYESWIAHEHLQKFEAQLNDITDLLVQIRNLLRRTDEDRRVEETGQP